MTESNSFDEQYLLEKQSVHEFYSPGFRVWNDKKKKKSEQEQKQFSEDLIKQGVDPQEAASSTSGLEEPGVDPVSAFAGGFGGTLKTALGAGEKLVPSFFRSLSSGAVGAAAEYPIGAVTGKVEEKFPRLALPMTVALGFLSGATVERAIENSVKKRLGSGATRGAIKTEAAAVKEKINAGVFDESTTDAVNSINKNIGDASVEKALGTGVPLKQIPDADSKFLKLESDIKGKKYTGNINLPRINSTDDIKKSIDKTAKLFAPEFETAKRGVQSNKQTAFLATSLGMTPQELLKRKKGVAFNAEEALAARRILVSSADNLTQLAQKVQSLDATDLDKFEFRKALNTHYAIQAQVSGMTAEAGRALQSFNIAAKSSKVKISQIKDFMEAMPGGSVDDLAAAIVKMDSLEGVTTFARQVQRATTTDMVLEAWINGLLSGPQTHAVNTLSNSLVAIWQMPERVLASGISKALNDNAIGGKESLAQLYGLMQGSKEGLRAFTKSLGKIAKLQDVEPLDHLSKIEARRYRAITAENIRQLPLIKKISPEALEEGGAAARFADFMGEAVRTSGKMLVAEDDFFKSIGYRMELNARTYRRAVLEEGLTGEQASLRMREIVNNPQELAPDIHLAAIDAARYQTFTKPLGQAGQALQTAVSEHPAARVIMPFIRTPTNILKFAGERTPLAFVSKNVRDEIAAGGARRDLALAKISVGSTIMGIVASQTMEGNITGSGPSNSEMRKIKYDTGWQPYSVKVGDKYYSYGRLEPIGMVFGLAADFAEISAGLTEDEKDDLATAIVSSISNNVTSKTWLRGLSDALSTFEDPQRYGARWWQKFSATIVPTGVAQAERALSPEMSAVNSTMDAIKARIPWYSDKLPPARNMWGEVIAPEGGLGPDIISPVYTSTVKLSPISEELLDMRIGLRMPSKTQVFDGVGIPLEPKEYDRFLVLMNKIPLDSTGKTLKESLNYLVTKDGEYKNTRDPEIKEMMIRGFLTEARFVAKEQLKIEFDIINEVISSEIERKEQLQSGD